MHLLIDAPRWRIAGLPPIVSEVSTIGVSVDGHHVIVTDGMGQVSFSVFEHEISFVGDSQRGDAYNRRLDFQVFQADPA